MRYAVKTSLCTSSRKGKIGSLAYFASTKRKSILLTTHRTHNPIISGSVMFNLLLTRLSIRMKAKIEVASTNAPRKSMRRNFDTLVFSFVAVVSSACADSM